MHSALSAPDLSAAFLSSQSFGKTMFASPRPAGRRITAGFTWLQRIGKAASHEVWFPQPLRERLDRMAAQGREIEPKHFPAEWAAIRQVELLQESGNYKIYDMDVTHLTRTLVDLTRSMRAGGYRVTIAALGSYSDDGITDDLAILDQRLQTRISQMIHMLYLEEQSGELSEKQHKVLAEGAWDFRTALPHVGVTLGARDLFRPANAANPSAADRKQTLARKFFDILSLLPQNHIVHDTAVGLQLPESINENEWIYLAPGDETLAAFNGFVRDVFGPFGGNTHHMRGHGDRLTPESHNFYQNLAQTAFGM